MNKKIALFIFLAITLLGSAVFGQTEENGAYSKLPYKELIIPPGMMPSPHSPSIVELPDGELFAVWYSSRFKDPVAIIWGSRKLAGSDKWITPYIINSTPGQSNKNPILYLSQDKRLFLFWVDEKRWIFKIVKDTLRMKVSKDLGRTWDEPRSVGNIAWFLPRTHLLRLSDGQLILPIYTDLSTTSAVAISKDDGLTWDGPKYLLFLFGIQPTIIQRSDSSLFALMRTGMWPRLCWQAVSYDFGYTWKKQGLSNVQNPGFSLEMIKLKSGNVVMAFNDSKKSRSSLSLALSYDEGKTWPCVRTIECKAGRVFGYPSIMQDKNGLIHLLYSYDNRTNIAHYVTDERSIEGRAAGRAKN